MVARGVPPERALAWWSDFREGKADHAWVRRRILARGVDGRVTMEDRGFLFRERTTARALADRVTFEGVNTFSRFVGAYVFEREGTGGGEREGTRVTLEAEVRLKAGWRPFEVVARPVARALVRADLRYHARQLERGWGSMRRSGA